MKQIKNKRKTALPYALFDLVTKTYLKNINIGLPTQVINTLHFVYDSKKMRVVPHDNRKAFACTRLMPL